MSFQSFYFQCHSECESCYGAQSFRWQCCNTCEDVVNAYQLKDWEFNTADFSQCGNGTEMLILYD